MMTPPLACMTSWERVPDREWVRSDRRVENPEIPKEEIQCSWLKDHQHSIEEPWESQGEEEAEGVKVQPGARGDGEGAEKEETDWAEGG